MTRSLVDSARSHGIEVSTDVGDLADAARDFSGAGGIRGRPIAIVRPRDADAVARIVASAAESETHLTLRGRGFSAGGQSVARDSVAVDLGAMNDVEPPRTSDGVLSCGPGARWSELVHASRALGALPASLPLNLEMTVGGLASVGGIGDRVHRTGPIAATVRSLEAVTGEGRRIWCDAEREPDLFHAVRAGQGRFGVIVRASVAVRPVRARVRTFQLLYDSPDAWLDDQETFAADPRCEHLEGFCWAGAKGSRVGPHGRRPFVHWLYGIHAGFAYDRDRTPPDERDALVAATPWRLLGTDDDDAEAHAQRYESRYAFMRRSGAFSQMHPWLEYFVSRADLESNLAEVLDALPPLLGDGHRTFVLARQEPLPSLALPERDPVFCFAVLPAGVPALLYHDAIAALRRADRLFLQAGGKRYLSGWIDRAMRPDWARHFGTGYERWRAAKDRFDPRGLFVSMLFDDEAGS